jgi:hypothetical protein
MTLKTDLSTRRRLYSWFHKKINHYPVNKLLSIWLAVEIHSFNVQRLLPFAIVGLPNNSTSKSLISFRTLTVFRRIITTISKAKTVSDNFKTKGTFEKVLRQL